MPSVADTLAAHARARAAPPLLDGADDPAFITIPDGRRVLRDGVRYSVPAVLVDSDPEQQASLEARFQMGLLSDAELKAYVEQARQESMAIVADAWRKPAGWDQGTFPHVGTGMPHLPAPPPPRRDAPLQPPPTIREQGWTAAMKAKQDELREINEAIVSDAEAAAAREAADEAFDRETERRSQAWRRATW